MASSANDGGVGGKFRRRPFRKAPATPYDRPQAAIRRVNPNPNNLIGGNNGWISKIVDPASRIIARGASKFFASVFQKRLTGPQPQPYPPPPPPSEENLLPGCRAPEAACNNLQMQKPSEKAPAQKGANVGENVVNLNNTDGCEEETISVRDGFIELEQLLKKKTFTRVEFDRLTDLLRSRTVEPSTSKQPVDYEKKEETMVAEEAHYKTQSIVEPSTSQLVFSLKSKEKIIISEQEDKTKSSSLHRNVKDSAVNLCVGGQPSQIPEEEASPTELAKEYMGSRPSKVSPSTLSLRSQILQEDTTLSTEPYSKKPSMALLASRPSIHSSQIAEHSDSGYMTPRPHGRSALYKMSRSPYFNVYKTTNIRGGRPVRYGLASSSMSSPLVPLNMLSSGKKVLKRGSAVLDSDVGSFGPLRRIRQKSDLMSPSERHSSHRNLLPSLTSPLHQDVNERSGSATQKTFAGVTSVPPQSTEMARKIFLELDKLVPSLREKLSENKASGSPLPSLRNSISPKQDRIKDNGPSENASAVKATDAVVGMGSPLTSSTDVRSSRKNADTTTVSDSAAVPSREEPAFQMTLAEKSLEWGAKYNMASASGLSTSGSDKLLGKSLAYPSKSIAVSSSMLKGDVVKASDRPATEKRVDFMLSPAPDLGSQPSLTPAIPPSLADSSITKKEISAPASKSASEGLSTTNAMCGAVSLKVGVSATTTGIIESPGLDNGGKTQKAEDFHRSFENATTSGSSTSTSAVLFTSGACIGPSQSNGSLTSHSSFLVSAGSAAAYFSDISTTANSSTQSVSVAQAIVASTPSFQFGSGTSGAAPISFPVSGDKSDAGDSDRKSVKTSPFAISSSIAPGTSNAFSNTNITGSSPATSYVFSNIGGISSAPATSSSLLLNAASGSSLLTTSSAFPSPTNGIFGFSASAQSSTSLSFATNSFSNSGSHFVGTAGSTIGPQPTQLGSGTTIFPSSAVQGSSFSSGPTFGLNSFSTLNSVTSPFGDATSVSKTFSSHAGFSSAAAGSSTPASIPSFPPIASSSLFSSNTQQSASSMLPSTLGSNPFLPSTGFVFGSPAPSGKTVGASSGPVFSFSSARTTTSAASPSPAQPVSNIPMPGTGFGSSSPGDDRMNVEDAMIDDSIQASGPSVPTFGQPANSLPFGTPAAPSGGPSVFQFGSNQNSTVPQNSFQSAGSFEFSAGGGSFSLGSGAGDKSGRRIVRVKRDKHRKK